MFVQFNYTNFPNVYVTFGKLNSTEEFNILTSEWLRLYEQKIPFFTFIFDASNLEVYNIKYYFLKCLRLYQ